MEYCPLRFPFKASRRFEFNAARSPSDVAASRMRSRFSACFRNGSQGRIFCHLRTFPCSCRDNSLSFSHIYHYIRVTSNVLISTVFPSSRVVEAFESEHRARLAEAKGGSAEQIDGVAQKLKLSRASVYRLLARFKDSREATSLLPAAPGRKNGTQEVGVDQEKIIDELIAKFYLSRQRPGRAVLRMSVDAS
jgi:hypothetical protein